MKCLFLTIAVSALSVVAQAESQIACVVTGDSNVQFAKSSEQPDQEYATIEKASSNGITFYLRSGHGVIRLEAWRKGKLVANTFAQEGNKEIYGDALNISVQTKLGQTEAQCYGINAAVQQL